MSGIGLGNFLVFILEDWFFGVLYIWTMVRGTGRLKCVAKVDEVAKD